MRKTAVICIIIIITQSTAATFLLRVELLLLRIASAGSREVGGSFPTDGLTDSGARGRCETLRGVPGHLGTWAQQELSREV